VVRSPEGQEFPSVGCYLDVIEKERLVWTTALGPGYRPTSSYLGFPITAVISLEPSERGTRYSALAMHGDVDARKRHAEMGFSEGWGAALDQLVALAKEM
jgi:uncharacterized protein YndB with AHSA1/START domain